MSICLTDFAWNQFCNFCVKSVEELSKLSFPIFLQFWKFSVEIAETSSHTFSQKFRESNGFTKEINEDLIWRFFFFSVKENWRNYRILLSRFYRKNFVKATLLKKFFSNWFDEKIACCISRLSPCDVLCKNKL